MEAPGIESGPGQLERTKEHQNGSIGTDSGSAIVPTSASKCAIARRIRTESSKPFLVDKERTAALAELFLRACALGAPCNDLALALANAVVDAAGARLALEVLDGGEHRLARATELAGRVLDSVRAEAERAGRGSG